MFLSPFVTFFLTLLSPIAILLLSPRVSDGPRCCYMDGHVILNTQGVLDSVVVPAKGIRTGCPDAPSDGFISHGEKEIYKSVGLFLGIQRLPGDLPFFFVRRYIYPASGVLFLSLMVRRSFLL